MSPPLRASNEGLLRPRVARAQGTHPAIPLLLADFFNSLLRPILRCLGIPKQQIASRQDTDEFAVPNDRHPRDVTILE